MDTPRPISYDTLMRRLPTPSGQVDVETLRQAVEADGKKVVVLDDDPTGCQTVYGVPIWTTWEVSALIQALAEPGNVFYIITNSRSLSEVDAMALNRSIVANLAEAIQATGTEIAIVSRSDSTLRGYYPAETDALEGALREHLGLSTDGVLVIPFFAEGGRLTAHDVHWVRQGETLWPAAKTESARDPAFGYRHSNLKAWVEEKSAGRIGAEDVASISLADIRVGGAEAVVAKLTALVGGQVAVVNAVTYDDMDRFVLGLLQAEAQGKRYLYRTAASFVRSRAGLGSRPLLGRGELLPEAEGVAPGLVIFGSFVPRSTEQLGELLAWSRAAGIELRAAQVIGGEAERETEIARVVADAEEAFGRGAVPVVYTSRELVTTDREGSLQAGQLISAALVQVVRQAALTPQWILAKGGITAHDVATKALDARRSVTPGQVAPGVPVWRLGAESRYPGLPYIVFPGNVGEADTVLDVVRQLQKAEQGSVQRAE